MSVPPTRVVTESRERCPVVRTHRVYVIPTTGWCCAQWRSPQVTPQAIVRCGTDDGWVGRARSRRHLDLWCIRVSRTTHGGVHTIASRRIRSTMMNSSWYVIRRRRRRRPRGRGLLSRLHVRRRSTWWRVRRVLYRRRERTVHGGFKRVITGHAEGPVDLEARQRSRHDDLIFKSFGIFIK